MANRNLSSNQYSLNDLDRVSFATLAIFSTIANVDRSSRPVESRSVVQVWRCIRAVLYFRMVISNCFQHIDKLNSRVKKESCIDDYYQSMLMLLLIKDLNCLREAFNSVNMYIARYIYFVKKDDCWVYLPQNTTVCCLLFWCRRECIKCAITREMVLITFESQRLEIPAVCYSIISQKARLLYLKLIHWLNTISQRKLVIYFRYHYCGSTFKFQLR